jgi:hypothetical protein
MLTCSIERSWGNLEVVVSESPFESFARANREKTRERMLIAELQKNGNRRRNSYVVCRAYDLGSFGSYPLDRAAATIDSKLSSPAYGRNHKIRKNLSVVSHVTYIPRRFGKPTGAQQT